MSNSENVPAKAGERRRVHVGVGGWTYEPWRNNFFPQGLPHSQELAYASRRLTAIEVNGTYYSTFKPATFAKWRDETPDGFVFSLKANRFATNRKVLATAGESIERFVGSGIAELGDNSAAGVAIHADQAVRSRDSSLRPRSQVCGRAPCAGCPPEPVAGLCHWRAVWLHTVHTDSEKFRPSSRPGPGPCLMRSEAERDRP
jgi:hypothetical protein